MNICGISSAPLHIRQLRELYKYELPEEVNILKKENAESSLHSDITRIVGDEAVANELQNDCSLENLYFDGECTSLEEVLQIVPDRKDLLPMKTLSNLQNKFSRLGSKRTPFQNLIQRVPKPYIDLSYKNSVDESPNVTEMLKETIVTVYVYKPLPLPVVDYCTQTRYLVPSQRLELLASQTLAELRDAIQCPQDKVWLGDCSEALDDSELHVPARRLYTSSYFFINGTFYDDTRDSHSAKLSACVIAWAKQKEVGSFTSASVETPLFEVTVPVGKPCFFLHQGNCEHLIVFADIKLLDRDACQSPSAFPILTGRCASRVRHCAACRRLACRWLVKNAKDLLPVDPCLLCDVCLRLLLYTEEGRKIHPDFQVHMYCGYEILV